MQIMEMARGCNQSFEELPSIDQQLTFSKLSIELIRVLGIEQLNRDILKTLELYSDQNGLVSIMLRLSLQILIVLKELISYVLVTA